MTLPAVGQPISLAQIQTEFGGAAPTGIDEYYRNGTYVPSQAASSIPTSGQIDFAAFRGASNTVIWTYNGSTNLYTLSPNVPSILKAYIFGAGGKGSNGGAGGFCFFQRSIAAQTPLNIRIGGAGSADITGIFSSIGSQTSLGVAFGIAGNGGGYGYDSEGHTAAGGAGGGSSGQAGAGWGDATGGAGGTQTSGTDFNVQDPQVTQKVNLRYNYGGHGGVGWRGGYNGNTSGGFAKFGYYEMGFGGGGGGAGYGHPDNTYNTLLAGNRGTPGGSGQDHYSSSYSGPGQAGRIVLVFN